MTRILTSDILIADVIAPIAENPKLLKLIENYGLKPGGKTALTKEQFDEFSAAIQGHPITIMPGGSSANTLTTLSKLLGKPVDVSFVGVVGDGMYSSMIRNSLEEAHIRLLPEHLPSDAAPQTAVSYVLLFPDGQRTIATYPGNAKEILKPDILTEDMVRNNDALLVQGSLWQKLDWDFADKLLKWRWTHKKELWLAMPTHAKFGEDKAEHFKWLIPSANVVLSNEEELARVYNTDPEKALQRLQEAFKSHQVLESEGRSNGRKPVGFITRGEKGAAIVTADKIDYVDAIAIQPDKIVNTLGAGDTSFAGFLAGYIQELPHKTSAQLGMALASAKLRENGPRLADPKAALRHISSHLANEVLSCGMEMYR